MEAAINKYLIIQDVPYEGKNTWTVFAYSADEAKNFVAQSSSVSKQELTYDTLKYNIKGSKFKGIHKQSRY